MTLTALDASYTQHPAPEVSGAGFSVAMYYTGNARPSAGYLAELVAYGIGVMLIQESNPERALEGYGAGVVDGQYAARRVEEAGLPDWVTIPLCVSDNTANTPSGAAAAIAIQAYVQGFSDACGNHRIALYGNRFAVDAGRNVAKVVWTWVPSTWYANDSDGMWQMANIPSPLDGTDLNWILIPLAQVGAWGTSAPAPAPTPETEDDDMYVGWGTDSDGVMFTDKIDGGITTIPFSGTVSQYGFYQDGYDYATKYGVKFVLMSADEIAFARLRNWNERHPAPAPAPLDPTVTAR